MLHKNQIKLNKGTKQTYVFTVLIRELGHHGWKISLATKRQHYNLRRKQKKKNRKRFKQKRTKVQRKTTQKQKNKIETWGALWLEHDPKAILDTRFSRFLWLSEAVTVVETVVIPTNKRKHRHSHRRGHSSTPICRKVTGFERSEEKTSLFFLYQNLRPMADEKAH